MDYQLEKTTLSTLQACMDTVSEQPVDADVTLPDYCPDIERILKCRLIPSIGSKSISGGQINIDGDVTVRVLYADSEQGRLRSFEHTQPYSVGMPLKGAPDQYILSVHAKPEYINCRALSPRRLGLHGAFSLCIRVLCRSTAELVCGAGESDLQIRRCTASASDLTCLCEERFSVTEDIALSDKDPVESILSSEVKVRITELKPIRQKLMLTGEAELSLLYLSDAQRGETDHFSYVFPLSRMIDCDGAEEDTMICPRLEVMSYDLTRSNDALSSSDLLSMELRLGFSAIGFTEKPVEYIVDAFSTTRPVELKQAPASCISSAACKTYTADEKMTVMLEDETVGTVVDVSSGTLTVAPVIGEQQFSFACRAPIFMILKDPDGKLYYIERSLEFELTPESDGCNRIEWADGSVESLSFRIIDEKQIELRVNCRVCALTSRGESLSTICGVSASDDAERARDDSALILYYADGGEQVWDIAKRFGICPDAILGENALEGDTVDDACMLLIPTG